MFCQLPKRFLYNFSTAISQRSQIFLISCSALVLLNTNSLQPLYAQSDTTRADTNKSEATTNPSSNSTKIDNNYFYVISKHGIMRWPVNAMPLRVYIKPGDTTDGYRPVFSQLLQQSFTDWSEASQGHVRFAFIDNPTNAQVICSWTSDKSDMTRLSEGGHALVIPEGHDIRRAEIIILTKGTNNENLSDQFFKRVALHEIGHTLGITDHSTDPSDMMYGAPPPTTLECALTTRDKNTLLLLYSLNQSAVNHSVINIDSMLPDRDNQSNLARIIRLNAEASTAMQNKNLALAVAKLEEAHSIDPHNVLVNTNLGSAYGNCAVVACIIKDNKKAQLYFSKAVPLLAAGENKENYLSVLKCYESFLRSNQNIPEADKIRKKIQTLSVH